MDNDVISRSALKESIQRYMSNNWLIPCNEVLKRIDNAPTVKVGYLTNCANCERVEKIRAKRPQGKWRVYEGVITCEKCGEETEEMTPFCAWCGADMRGEEE